MTQWIFNFFILYCRVCLGISSRIAAWWIFPPDISSAFLINCTSNSFRFSRNANPEMLFPGFWAKFFNISGRSATVSWSPSQTFIMYSIVCFSSRTFPGQRWVRKVDFTFSSNLLPQLKIVMAYKKFAQKKDVFLSLP